MDSRKLEIDMALVRYEQDEVLNRGNKKFVKTCVETSIQKNEDFPLTYDVILY